MKLRELRELRKLRKIALSLVTDYIPRPLSPVPSPFAVTTQTTPSPVCLPRLVWYRMVSLQPGNVFQEVYPMRDIWFGEPDQLQLDFQWFYKASRLQFSQTHYPS